MNELSVFNQRLSKLLEDRGLNQINLCELTGLSSAQANHLVRGKTKDPKLSTACKIALALDVSLDYLGGLIDEPRPIRRDENGRPVFRDPRQERINSQYEDMNERGQRRAADSVDDIHSNPRNLKGEPEVGLREAR